MKKEIKELVKQVLGEHFGMSTPIISICQRFDFSVFEQELEQNVTGFIVVTEEPFMHYGKNRVIVTNSKMDTTCKKITIAQLLGCYFLYKKPEEKVYARRCCITEMITKIDEQKNREAICFAFELLLPEEELKRVLSKKCGYDFYDSYYKKLSIERVAEYFAVSEEAVRIRLEQLNLHNASEKYYRWFRNAMN